MRASNYTQISNEFIDNMSQFSGSAVKVFVAISRRTIGWHKISDRISYSQLKKMTGIKTHNTLQKAIQELIDAKLIIKEKTELGYVYDLNIDIDASEDDITEETEESDEIENKTVSESDTDKNETVSKNNTGMLKNNTGVLKINTGMLKINTGGVLKINTTKENIYKENIYTHLLNFWNSQNIIKHRKLTDKMKRKIKSALKDYTIDEIKEAIVNYATILKSDEYFWTYSWTLSDFLQRGLERFLTSSKPFENFKKKEDNYAKDRRDNQHQQHQNEKRKIDVQRDIEYLKQFSRKAKYIEVTNTGTTEVLYDGQD